MEKKKKLDVSDINLVSFEGFYQTIWCPEFEISDYEFENEVEEDNDFTFDNDGYEKTISKAYTQQWERLLQLYISQDIKLSFVGVQHPLFYNYSTDTIQVKIGLTSEAKDAIMAKVKDYREKIAIWIISNHTSCDGFWSFLSNHIKDWNRTALFNHKSDHQEEYLAYMLYYIMLAECGFSEADSQRLDLWAFDYVNEQVSVTDFITYPGNNKAA